MSLTTKIAAATALATALVAAPVLSLQAEATPVRPSTHELAIPALPTAQAAPEVARSRTEHGHAVREAAHLPARGVSSFDVVGVTYSGEAPAGLSVEVKVKHRGRWSAWQELEKAPDGPDRDTEEGRRAQQATAPLTAADSDGIEVRVSTADGRAPEGLRVTMIDGGSSPADSLRAPAGAAGAAVARPTIHTRAQWGADESLKPCSVGYGTGFQGAAIHHTVNSNSYTQAQVPSLLRGILYYHTQTQRWCDFGYNFVVDRYGTVWEGRTGSITRFPIGAHAQGFNSSTVGVSTLGDFTSASLPAATVSSLARVIAWQATLGRWDPRQSAVFTSLGNATYPQGTKITRYRTMGHRDLYGTSCPGSTAYAQLPGIRASTGAVWSAGGSTPFPGLTPTSVVETFARPTASTVTLAGRGYGHGRGMSQWGAYGAATRGLMATQIGSFYYPGTASAYAPTTSLRVRLSALGTSGTTIAGGSGLTMSYGGSEPKALAAVDGNGRRVTAWRVVPDGTGLTLQWQLDGSTWVSSVYWTRWRSPITFSSSTGAVRTVLPSGLVREYAGSVTTSVSAGVTTAVNTVGLEDYLKGVVPAEMPASWPVVALQAQAIAARTYALYSKAHSTSTLYDTCDSTSCQVYSGRADRTASGALVTAREQASTTYAVTTSAGLVRTYAGAPALTEFSSANGGVTTAGPLPYQVLQADPYDGVVAAGNPREWTLDIPVSQLEARFPSVGTFRSIQVLARTGSGLWGGRTSSVRVVGDRNVQTVTGAAFRAALGLRSEWFVMSSAPAAQVAAFPKDLTGDGLPDLFGYAGGLGTLLKGTASFGATAGGLVPGWGDKSLVTQVGPWDSDNRGDVLARTPDGQLWAYRGGSPTINHGRALVSSSFAGYSALAAPGDFDGDRLTDFVARSAAGELILFSGNGSGGIKGTRRIAGGWNTFSQVFSAGDLTGDGRTDLVGVYATGGQMRIYPGTGSGTLGTSLLASGPGATLLAPAVWGVGDRTGDGRHDLFGKRSDGAVLVYRVSGAGVLDAPTVLTSASSALAYAR